MSTRIDVLAAIPRHAIQIRNEGSGWTEHHYLDDTNVDEHVQALVAVGLVARTVTGLHLTPAGQQHLDQLDGRDLTV